MAPAVIQGMLHDDGRKLSKLRSAISPTAAFVLGMAIRNCGHIPSERLVLPKVAIVAASLVNGPVVRA